VAAHGLFEKDRAAGSDRQFSDLEFLQKLYVRWTAVAEDFKRLRIADILSDTRCA
jgi:hypothetical protein